jgi:tryptophan-rich sensory protein
MNDGWTRPRAWMQALSAILLCEGVGLLAAWGTRTSVATWYPTLTKPFFTPPDWLFAPVWTVLYAMMGVAAVLVWWRRSEDRASQNALVLFGVQLLLNGAWSFAFFGARSPILGLVVILALWGAVAGTTERFFRIRAGAGWLLVPYLLWVTYAAALNLGVWLLN